MTMAYIALATAAVTALSAYRQGQAQEANANYQAAQGEENAKQVMQQTSSLEDEQRAKARQVIGAQIAAQAGSGTQLNGSAADMLRQSLFNAESDAQQIRYEGKNRALGLQGQAAATRLQGKQARQQGTLNAATSLMQGAGQAYGYNTQSKINAANAAKAGG